MELAEHDRSGKPEKTSWEMMQQVVPHREEPLLDGNAYSVRYGEMIHDGSGKPDKVNYQEKGQIPKLLSWEVTCAIGERPRGDPWFGQNSLVKEFMETTVTDW